MNNINNYTKDDIKNLLINTPPNLKLPSDRKHAILKKLLLTHTTNDVMKENQRLNRKFVIRRFTKVAAAIFIFFALSFFVIMFDKFKNSGSEFVKNHRSQRIHSAEPPNAAALTKNKKASPITATSMLVNPPPGPGEIRLDTNLDGEKLNRRVPEHGWIQIGSPGLLWRHTGGTYLNFIQEDAFIYVSVDDGPLELAGVRLRALDDLDFLYFALIESEAPLALWCDIQPPMEISELPFLEKITSFQQVEPNALSDLAPLAHLPNLESVNIKARRKNLPHASIYSLPQIEDSSPLSSLTKLKVLTLSACFNITSISDLGTDLTYLDLSSCINISDMSFLTRLTNLTYLNLRDCGKVSDLKPLAELTKLKHLDLGHCRNLSDLMPLSMLTHLTFLDLTGCKVADFLPVENLTSLETLGLTFCGNLSDLSPLKNLTSLRSLGLSGCHKLANLWPLAELTSLEYLNLRSCKNIPDLEALAGLTNLRKLDCQSCPLISDLSPLSNLTNLTKLNFARCPNINDLSPLSNLTNITGIIMHGCESITDLSPIQSILTRRRSSCNAGIPSHLEDQYLEFRREARSMWMPDSGQLVVNIATDLKKTSSLQFDFLDTSAGPGYEIKVYNELILCYPEKGNLYSSTKTLEFKKNNLTFMADKGKVILSRPDKEYIIDIHENKVRIQFSDDVLQGDSFTFNLAVLEICSDEE